MRPSFRSRLALGSLGATLVFAVVFTLVDLRWGWPGLPYETLRDVDLAAGFAFVGAVILLLLPARPRGGPNRIE